MLSLNIEARMFNNPAPGAGERLIDDVLAAPMDERTKAHVLMRVCSLHMRPQLAIEQSVPSGTTLYTDIAIIGAGMQGMQLAFALADAKRDFVVLERSGLWGGGFYHYAAAVGQGSLITPIHFGLEPAAGDQRPPFTLLDGWRYWLADAPPHLAEFFEQWPGDTPPRAPLVGLWEQIRHYVERYRLNNHGYAFGVADIHLPEDDDEPVEILGADGSRVVARQVALALGRGSVRHAANHYVAPRGAGMRYHPRVLPLLERDMRNPAHQVQADKRVLIIGGGNSAANWAAALTEEAMSDDVLIATRGAFGPQPFQGGALPDEHSYRRLPLDRRVELIGDGSGVLVAELHERVQAQIERRAIRVMQHTGEVTRIEVHNNEGLEQCVVSFERAEPITCDRVFLATGFDAVSDESLYAGFPSIYADIQRNTLMTCEGYALPDGVFWEGSARRLVPLCRSAMLWFPPQPMPAAKRSQEIVEAMREQEVRTKN
jgi:thioredoxin reductase